MAVAGDGALVAMTWDPRAKWDGLHEATLAHFASPNRREGKPNHLMSLLLPGLTDQFAENVSGLPDGWTPRLDDTLTIEAAILARPGSEDVVDAVRACLRESPRPLSLPDTDKQVCPCHASCGFPRWTGTRRWPCARTG